MFRIHRLSLKHTDLRQEIITAVTTQKGLESKERVEPESTGERRNNEKTEQ